jgi:shikimate dehydrogenase
MNYRLGLTGFPLSHSLSPRLHSAALRACGLDGDYHLYPVSPDDPQPLVELIERLRLGDLHGLNVTIPYKQTIIPLLDGMTSTAQAIGAVNTIFLKDNMLIGHNTDAPGFLTDLAKFSTSNSNKKDVLVLGAGGAARAIVYSLLTDGWSVTLAVRHQDVGQARALIESLDSLEKAKSMRYVLMEVEDLYQFERGLRLIVNATPIGMYPDVESSPWPIEVPFPQEVEVYDLVYNPRQTRLIKDAREAGLRAATGLGMLVEQAALSFRCWTGKNVHREVLYAAMEA